MAEKAEKIKTTERVKVTFTGKSKHNEEGATAMVHPVIAKSFKKRGLIK